MILFLPLGAHAALKSASFWASDGSYKMARQDEFPLGVSSNTISENWDGRTAKTFAGRNETVSLVFYMTSNGSDSTEVNVTISSFTGPSGAGIVSPLVSSTSVFDWTTRPTEIFYVRYLPINGQSGLMLDSEYDAYHYPVRWRRPCTVNVNNACAPNGGTTWTDRPDHDKYYPEILIPYEAVAASSFTVAASSSQAIWVDIFVPKGQAPGTYTANFVVKEGVSVSTTIPVELTVKGYTLPDSPYFKFNTFVSDININRRHYNNAATLGVGPMYTTMKRYRQMLRRHKMAGIWDDNDLGASGTDEPYYFNKKLLNGELSSAATGYGNAPGIDMGTEFYSIGTYGKALFGGWPGADTNDTTFCGRINNWATWFRDNQPTKTAFFYITDEPASLLGTNRYSTWMSTVCAQTATYKVKSLVTAGHVVTNSTAPYTHIPLSTSYTGFSSATIQTAISSYTANQTFTGFYNSYRPYTGLTLMEGDGFEPRELAWGAYRKGVNGWFLWETTYFTGDNNGYCRTPDENDIWNSAQTYGCGSPTYNTDYGLRSFQYANGDGVFMYPLTDTYDTGNSYGLDGPAASWRLKMIRRGIQDYDYLTMAYAANPSATTTALETITTGKVMWERNCHDLGDCTYSYGPVGFSETAKDYEAARRTLSDLIPASDDSVNKSVLGGRLTFGGGVTFR